jgi:hypothetical protein
MTRRPEGHWRAVLVTALVAGCSLVQPLAADATSAADRAVTHTFLQATYTFDLDLVRNTAKTSAALESAAGAIAAECPKVLAGAPGGPTNLAATEGINQLAPRARGEADRHQRQYQELTSELEGTLHSAGFQIDSRALATFTATVTPLRWSNPAIARAVQFELSLVHTILAPGAAPAICADMHSWVASGYRTVSAATKAFQAQQESLLASPPPLETSSEALLEPYEGPRERAILKRREALPTSDIFELRGSSITNLHRQLGFEEESDAGISGGINITKSKALGHGRTHIGTRFSVEAVKGYGPGCPHIINFSVTLPSEYGNVTSSSGSSLRCLSGKRPAPRPRVSCEEGILQIESSTLAQTRRVRLRLSNGRTIVSPVTLVPRKYGGPAGVYFQLLRGPSPYPVSLSELDAQGQLTRTVALRAVKHCHVILPKPAFRQIVKGNAPNGHWFTIVGFSNKGGAHRTFDIEAEGPAFSDGSDEASSFETPSMPRTKDFPWRVAVGCEPHPYALVYGQLSAPGTSVLVATATTPLAPLIQVKFPTALDEPGTLAYSVLAGLPTELVVTGATGATLAKEDLTASAKSETEYCEGYAEPTG